MTMLPVPRFLEKDPALRAARTKAWYYLNHVVLSNPGFGSQKFPPRTLQKTLEEEFRVDDPDLDPAMDQAEESIESKMELEKPKEYDPAQEKANNEMLDAAMRNEQNLQRLREIRMVLVQLADPEHPIAPESIPQLKQLLQEGKQFIASQLLPDINESEVVAGDNRFHNTCQITRKVAAIRYPNLESAEAAEYTRQEHKDTFHVLRFAHEMFMVKQLALSNLMTAIEAVSQALDGKTPGHAK